MANLVQTLVYTKSDGIHIWWLPPEDVGILRDRMGSAGSFTIPDPNGKKISVPFVEMIRIETR